MKEGQRKLYISKIETEYASLLELKNKLQELKENPLIKQYLELEASLKTKTENLYEQEKLAIKEVFQQEECHHDIYVFMGYGNLNDGKFITANFLYSFYAYYKCLECGQDFYIRKHDVSKFKEEHHTLSNPDPDNPSVYFKKAQAEYYKYLANNYSLAKAFKNLRK